MPAINFPNDPVEGQTFVAAGNAYKFENGTWKSTTGGADIQPALPPGGNAGDKLVKQSGDDYDAAFQPDAPLPETIILACSDEDTAIAATGTKLTFRMPFAMNLTAVRASLNSAAAAGTFTVDIAEGGASILGTLLTVDAGETTSTTAAAPAVIADGVLADDAEMTISAPGIADGTATGLKVTLIGTRA